MEQDLSPHLNKKCKTCSEEKAATEFYKEKARGDGLDTRCKNCQRSLRRKRRAKKYGLDWTWYRGQLLAQNGKCAICYEPPAHDELLHIDHDHATEEVRGLLCRNCNLGLGFFGDSLPKLMSAFYYLGSAELAKRNPPNFSKAIQRLSK